MLFLANPYTSSFPHIKCFEISANPGVGYQIKLVDALGDSLVLFDTGNMNTDFSDIRFSDEDGNQLGYWIQSKTDSTSAIVYVKTVSATATKIYMNYGNESAVSESDISIMEFGDQFLGASLDDTKWEPTAYPSGSITYTLENGVKITDAPYPVWITGNTATGTQLQSKWTPLSSFVAECTVEIANTVTKSKMGQLGIALIGSDGKISATVLLGDEVAGSIQSSVLGFVETTNPAASAVTPASTTKNLKMVKNGTTVTVYYKGTSETTWTQRATATTTDVSKFAIVVGRYSESYVFVDYEKISDVHVRQYIETEPTFTEIPILVSGFSADVVTGTNPLTVTFTDSSTGTPTAWSWNFGDGNTSTSQNPEHEYLFPGTYKVSLTATNEGGSDTETKTDYIEVIPSASTIFIYMEKIEMDHKVGSTTKHTFKVAAANGSGFKSTCTNPVILCSKNGADETTETWTISAFSATMNRFTLEVVDPGTWAVGDNIEIVIYCDEGAATLHLNVVSDTVEVDTSGLATSAEVAALNDLSAQQVWEYASRGLTAIPTGTATATALSAVQGDITSIKSTVEGISVVGGTGAEKVIPRTYYELSAVANTITLSSPYDTITEEQIISICDLTTGDVIYSCEIPIKHTISVSSGVITFTYDNNSIAAEDILQIIVNQV